MKKTISILLVLVIALGLCACGNEADAIDPKEKYIGIWKATHTDDDGKNVYMYVYADGTGDFYFYSTIDKRYSHMNSFTWRIEDEYFVEETTGLLAGITKYSIKDNQLLNSQGKIKYNKVGDDPSIDK